MRPNYGYLENGEKFVIPRNLDLGLLQLQFPNVRQIEPTLMAGVVSSSGRLIDSAEFNIIFELEDIQRRKRHSLGVNYLATAQDDISRENGDDCCVGLSDLGDIISIDLDQNVSLDTTPLSERPEVVAKLFNNPLQMIEIYIDQSTGRRQNHLRRFGLKYHLSGNNLTRVEYVHEGDLFYSSTAGVLKGGETIVGEGEWEKISPIYRDYAFGAGGYRTLVVEEILESVVPELSKRIRSL